MMANIDQFFKINKQEHYEDIAVDASGKTMCILCNIMLVNDFKYIDNHLNKYKHKELFVTRLFQRQGLKDFGKTVSCLICCDLLKHEDVEDHMEDSTHKDTLELCKAMIIIDGGFIKLPGTKHNPDERLVCIACDQEFTFSRCSLYLHVRSPEHAKAKVMAIQPLNAIFPVEDTEDLYCKICQAYIDNYVEIIFSHVQKGRSHWRELRKIKKLINKEDIDIRDYMYDPKEDKAKCNRCKIEVSCNVYNLERHIKGRQHIRNGCIGSSSSSSESP